MKFLTSPSSLLTHLNCPQLIQSQRMIPCTPKWAESTALTAFWSVSATLRICQQPQTPLKTGSACIGGTAGLAHFGGEWRIPTQTMYRNWLVSPLPRWFLAAHLTLLTGFVQVPLDLICGGECLLSTGAHQPEVSPALLHRIPCWFSTPWVSALLTAGSLVS